MRAPSSESNQPASIADYLADREGLSGAPRLIFLRLVQKAFGFGSGMPRRARLAIGGEAAGVAFFGVWYEKMETGNTVLLLLWMALASLGAVLAIAISHAQRQPQPTSREIEWKVYCLLLRPWILAERPGLLDRNLAADQRAANEMTISPGDAAAAMLRSNRTNLWLPTAYGWGLGIVLLVAARLAAGPEIWPFGIPILGALFAPFLWGLFRVMVFHRMQRIALEKR